MSPRDIYPTRETLASRRALAEKGYICSGCLEPADKCRCPWEERRGIERKPFLFVPGSPEEAQ